jgi:hypothetical protein
VCVCVLGHLVSGLNHPTFVDLHLVDRLVGLVANWNKPNFYVTIARGFGQVLNFNGALILLPVCRNLLTMYVSSLLLCLALSLSLAYCPIYFCMWFVVVDVGRLSGLDKRSCITSFHSMRISRSIAELLGPLRTPLLATALRITLTTTPH